MHVSHVFLLAIVCVVVGYQFAYSPLVDTLGISSPSRDIVEADVENGEAIASDLPPPPKLVVDEPLPKDNPATQPESPPPSVAMTPTAPEPAPPTPEPEIAKPKSDEFGAPEFEPIETIVGNWKAIPKSVFPRQVKLKVPVEFVARVGSGTVATSMKPGNEVTALSQQEDSLTIAPGATGMARAEVGIDDTNIKEVLTEAYEKWKIWRTDTLRKAHEYRLTSGSQPQSGSTVPVVAGDPAPTRSPDGTYQILIASMTAGEVTEIKPDKVKEWSGVAREKIDGEDYWTVIVKYETSTIFGNFDTEAQARIKNGKVHKWVYTGSGEVVP